MAAKIKNNVILGYFIELSVDYYVLGVEERENNNKKFVTSILVTISKMVAKMAAST